ncbi:hypothetical protein HAX54_040322 [Datura stramonium]|uniref:Uncharacterized protein n=1 Tax=Datura stramonium TaxID=4076 RepID=A0ABS8SK07_DATST|nr:hypothetical protein [Datura stramonium]
MADMRRTKREESVRQKFSLPALMVSSEQMRGRMERRNGGRSGGAVNGSISCGVAVKRERGLVVLDVFRSWVGAVDEEKKGEKKRGRRSWSSTRREERRRRGNGKRGLVVVAFMEGRRVVALGYYGLGYGLRMRVAG